MTPWGSVPQRSSAVGSGAGHRWPCPGPSCSYSHPQDIQWLFLQLLPLFLPSSKNIPAAVTAPHWSLQPAKPSLTSFFPYLPSRGDNYGPYVVQYPIKNLQYNNTEATSHQDQSLGWQSSFKIHLYLLQWQILSLGTTYQYHLSLDEILGFNTGLYKYRPQLSSLTRMTIKVIRS